MSKHKGCRQLASVRGVFLLCAWTALSVFGGEKNGQGAPPSREDVSGAIEKAREALRSDARFAAGASKLDARLSIAFASRRIDLARTPDTEIMEAPAAVAQPRVMAGERPLAIPPVLNGLEGLPGHLLYEMVRGEPGVTVVVESPVPALLPVIAKRHSARYEGALEPVKSATFVIPISCLPDLLLDPDVSKVRAPVQHVPNLTNALSDTHTTVVHSDWNLHGSGSVYAAIDVGLDVSQMDFKTDATHTRIAYLWDQTITATPPSGYSYGTEWTSAQINAGSCTETSNSTADWGHGTSTSGVGAGNGSSGNGGYVGQADQADIIFVKSDLTNAHIEDGLAYIKAKAAAMGKPVAINMSFGGSWGPHDGGDDLSYWIDNSLGVSDSSTGIALAAAAGNDTTNQNHVGGSLCPENSTCRPICNGSLDDSNTQAFTLACSNSMYPIVEEFYFPASYTIQVRAWVPLWYRTSGSCTSGLTFGYGTTGWQTIDPANNGGWGWARKITGNNSCYDSFLGDGGTASPGGIYVWFDFQKPMADYHNANLQYVYVEYDPATTTQSPNHGGDLCDTSGGNAVPLIIQFRQNTNGSGSGARIDGYQAFAGQYSYFAAGGTATCRSGTTGGSYLNGNDDKMINGPAAAHAVMAVAGHVTRTSWTDKGGTPRSTTGETLDAIASYSTHGPLRGISEGNAVVTDQKPNLSAPSEAVITSLSDDFAAGWYTTTPQSQYMPLETPINKHIAQEGTSFSSPQVAGAAALLLGVKPTLTLGQIRTDLQNGARSDANTGTVPNDTWGHGKLTLDNSLSYFANLVNRGTVATSLTPLGGGAGTYTDTGVLGNTTLYYYAITGVGNTLMIAKSGSDAVLTW